MRRLVRTQADHLVMEALVSHPDPDDLRLWVGVEPHDASGQAREVLLYDQGTTSNQLPHDAVEFVIPAATGYLLDKKWEAVAGLGAAGLIMAYHFGCRATTCSRTGRGVCIAHRP